MLAQASYGSSEDSVWHLGKVMDQATCWSIWYIVPLHINRRLSTLGQDRDVSSKVFACEKSIDESNYAGNWMYTAIENTHHF